MGSRKETQKSTKTQGKEWKKDNTPEDLRRTTLPYPDRSQRGEKKEGKNSKAQVFRNCYLFAHRRRKKPETGGVGEGGLKGGLEFNLVGEVWKFQRMYRMRLAERERIRGGNL